MGFEIFFQSFLFFWGKEYGIEKGGSGPAVAEKGFEFFERGLYKEKKKFSV